jgi:hypothetical protein
MEKRTTRKKATGLGDTVEQVLEVTGVAKVAKWIMGDDCNCEARKEKLNELFPYKSVKCLTEDEHTYLTESQVLSKQSLKPSEQDAILKIYNRIFGISREPTSCATCWMEIINKMKKVFNEYETA